MVGYCWLCDQSLTWGEGNGFCRPCLHDLPRLPPSCLRWRCLHPERSRGRYWFSALRWQADVQHLIHRFKFHRTPELASVLAPILAAQIHHCYQSRKLSWPDIIVAMPITYKRWVKRGYNQAGLLTLELEQLLQLPMAAGLLRQLRQSTQAQHQRDVVQRWQNMEGGIHCTREVTGLRVAIVDDVLTTGASVSAAAEALLRRGAKTVDAWTLAFAEPHQPLAD